jgi:hypothetical protein
MKCRAMTVVVLVVGSIGCVVGLVAGYEGCH